MTGQSSRTSIIAAPPGEPRPSAGKHLILDPDDMFAEAGRKVLLHHFDAMMSFQFPAVEGSNPEGVHQMRVAIRRFRSAYMVFRKAFPPRYGSVLQRTMKQTAKTLGAVRDMDVQLMRILAHIDANPQYAKAFEVLLKLLETRRNRARRSFMLWLDSQAYTRGIQRGFSLLSEPLTAESVADRHARRPLADAIPSIVYKRISDVDEFGRHIDALDSEELHELRIRCKKLRYTLESFETILGKGVKKMLRALKNVQDILGDRNDAVFMFSLIDGLDLGDEENDSAWRVYRTALHSAIASTEESLSGAYAKLFDRQNKLALARAIGTL